MTESIMPIQSNVIAEAAMDEKVRRVFGTLAIDKRRLPMSQLQKRGIPAYVAEWVLESVVPGIGPITHDEATKVQDWAVRNIPGPEDQNAVKSRLLRGETVKLLNPVQVEVILKRTRQEQIGKLGLLGIDDALIPDDLVKLHPRLLREGMWGVVELTNTPDGVAIVGIRPMQASVNLKMYKEARSEFSLEEWRSLMIASMGYNPSAFTEEQQLLLLCRLIALTQKNMTLVELAPKGTGKSYVFENVSPKVRLISGGNVSPAVLFVNNSTGQWGLLARFAVVVLDEVQTLKFDKPEEIIGGLKGYLANGKITRAGLHETSSNCGLVLLANITLDSEQRPAVDPIVKELPTFMQETAFLDRLRGMIPGWRLPKLSTQSFAKGVGLKSDFFGDVLVAMRDDLATDQYCARRIRLGGDKPYRRNEEAIVSAASGLMKILFPDMTVSDQQFWQNCVKPAIQLRQLIWNQLYQLDAEYRQYESSLDCQLLS
ncbi:MAG: BREX system Lon protease-like protein BrxL [Planctomycetaceae bacterium]|nr:BREX system Lon protease-like protein BrxL [Planctomycetaceae bacterium]